MATVNPPQHSSHVCAPGEGDHVCHNHVVWQGEAWLVERMGKYHRTLEPGMNVLVPIIDKVYFLLLDMVLPLFAGEICSVSEGDCH